MLSVFNLNKIIKTLVVTDLFIYSAWGFIMPVLAVFIVKSINGGDASVAGMAVGIYWVAKAVIQVPIGKYLDINHGEKDDYWFMFAGAFLTSLTPLGFLISSEPWHIYLIQIVHAVGMAMAVPSWGGIFLRHVDRGREAESWGFEASAISVGVGAAGIAGGFIAENFGFAPIFILVSVLGIIGSLGLLVIKKDIAPRKGGIVHIEKIGHG